MPSTNGDLAPPTAKLWCRLALTPWPAVVLGLLCLALVLINSYVDEDRPFIAGSGLGPTANWHDAWLRPWQPPAHGIAQPGSAYTPRYRPLTITSFALNHALGGPRPFGFHLLNLLLHGATCFLVWHFTRRLLDNRAAASIAAILFATHPIHVDAVAGLLGRAELLMTFFLLIGLVILLPRGVRSSPRRALLTTPVFLAALLANEAAVCHLPIALLALAATPRPGRTIRWWLLHAGGLLIPLMGYSLLRGMALGGRLFAVDSIDPVLNPLAAAPPFEHFLGAAAIVGHYGRLLVMPDQLSSDYGLGVFTASTGISAFVLYGAIVVAALCCALFGFTRRGVLWRSVALVAGIALLAYLPVSNIIWPLDVAMAERLLYWPSVPLLILAAVGISEFWRRQCVKGAQLAQSARLFAILGVLFVASFVLRSAVRTLDWFDSATLVSRDVIAQPRSLRLNIAHASDLLLTAERVSDSADRSALVDEARERLTVALDVSPTSADALAWRGLVCAHDLNIDGAILHAEAALLIAPFHRVAQHVLNAVYSGVPATERRLTDLNTAIEADPDDAELHLKLGALLLSIGQPMLARPHLQQAVDAAPDDVDALRKLGLAQASTGATDAALDTFRRVLDATPGDWVTHIYMAHLLAPGDLTASGNHARRAHLLEPNDVNTRHTLAESNVRLGRIAAALELWYEIERDVDEDNPYRHVVRRRIRDLRRG